MKDDNKFKQQCFEADKKAAGFKAVKLYLTVDQIEQAKKLFIPSDDTRKNVQREAVTKAFEAGIDKQGDVFTKTRLLADAQRELRDVQQQHIDLEQGTRQRIEELEMMLRCSEQNLKNERAKSEASVALELKKKVSFLEDALEGDRKIKDAYIKEIDRLNASRPDADSEVKKVSRCECLTTKGTRCKATQNLQDFGGRIVCPRHVKQYQQNMKLKFCS